VLVAALVVAAAASPAVAAAPALAAGEPVRRVLVVSLPTVTWADVRDADVPHLDRLFAQSALGDQLTRIGARRFSLANGYVSLGAGSRAVAPERVIGEGYGADEPLGGSTAGQVFARRTGLTVTGGLVQLGIEPIRAANEGGLYDPSVGALADTLAPAGIDRAVIGNADGLEADTPAAGLFEVHRPAVAGLMGEDGTVPAGRVDSSLLQPAPRYPFGVRLDADAVDDAFRAVWTGSTVVLVEGSDLLRVQEARRFTEPAQARRARFRALRHTDSIVGRLLADVDPARDAVIVTSPLPSPTTGNMGIVSLRAPGVDAGYLRSGTTRRTGFASIVDVAPTVLSLLGVGRPGDMEGRVMDVRGAGEADAAERMRHLAHASRDSVFRDNQQPVVATVLVLLAGLLALAALAALTRWRRGLPAVRAFALALVGFLLATYLAAPLHFARHGGRVAYWLFLVGVAIAFAGLCTVAGRRSFCDALLAALGATVALHLVDLLTGERLELNTVFGYSPTVGIRVAGEGNLTFAQLSASAVLLAGLVAWRVRGRGGRTLAIGVLAVTLLVMLSPTWGQDFGAASAAPGFVLLAWLLLGRRVRWPTVVALAAVLVAAALAVGFLDLLRPVDERTHVGRFFEQVGDEGLGAFLLVVRRKAGDNLASFGGTVFVWVLPIVGAFAVAALRFARADTVVALLRRVVTLRATLLALTVTAVLGYALNDSGVAVPAMMAVIAEAALVYLVAREAEHTPEPEVTPARSGADLPSGALRGDVEPVG
jgi:hypothetical protein